MSTQAERGLADGIVTESHRIGRPLSSSKRLPLLLLFLSQQSIVERNNQSTVLFLRLLSLIILTVQHEIPHLFGAVAKLVNNGFHYILIKLNLLLFMILSLLTNNYVAVRANHGWRKCVYRYLLIAWTKQNPLLILRCLCKHLEWVERSGFLRLFLMSVCIELGLIVLLLWSNGAGRAIKALRLGPLLCG